jgi:carbon monoxide dehydrogenase subunit G
MMQFEGEFTSEGTPEELWPYFTDTDILEDCVPGCKEMTPPSPSEIETTIAVGVGSVKPSFDVTGVVLECDRPRRLEIQASGEASRNSFSANAWTELHENDDGTTTVTWESSAEVSGLIASMGERALGSVADKLVNDYFQNIEEAVEEGLPAESELEAADAERVEALRADDEADDDEAESDGLLGRFRGGDQDDAEEDGDETEAESDEESATDETETTADENESDSDSGGGLRDRLSGGD